MSRLPEHLVLLVVQADEAAHAPVRAALKGIEGTEYEIHWVTTPRAALAALEEHPHDAFLVDRELHEPGHNGLDVAADILAHSPHAPVILLDDHADRVTDLAATEMGVSDYLVHPSPATLERSLRYAITHQRVLRRLAESEERHALALQGANDGLWDWDVRADKLYFSPRWKAMIGYPEAEIGDAPGEWLGRVHPDDRAGLTQALEGHLTGATQHFESEHRVQHRDSSYRWMLARGIAVRDQGIGMDQKEVRQIFRKFYRTKKAEESGEAGTGIGLSTMARRTTRPRRQVELRSRPVEHRSRSSWVPSTATVRHLSAWSSKTRRSSTWARRTRRSRLATSTRPSSPHRPT